MIGIMVPETCWASNKICNKNSSVASSWHFISTYISVHFFLISNFHLLHLNFVCFILVNSPASWFYVPVMWNSDAEELPRRKHTTFTCIYNRVSELIAVKVLHTSLLNTTVISFKVLPLGIYALIPAPSPPFKTILELVLWNGLQSCCCITPDVINVIKMPAEGCVPGLRAANRTHDPQLHTIPTTWKPSTKEHRRQPTV
jgi:hypothetical protein